MRTKYTHKTRQPNFTGSQIGLKLHHITPRYHIIIHHASVRLSHHLSHHNVIVTSSGHVIIFKHAPVISKLSRHHSKSAPWFTPALHAFRSSVRHAENIWKLISRLVFL